MRTLDEIKSHYDQWTQEQIRGIMSTSFRIAMHNLFLYNEKSGVLTTQENELLAEIRADYEERRREQTQTMLGMDFLSDMGGLLKLIDQKLST